jgi:hypothetical protein
MNYLSFLKLLIALGPKLPQVMVLVQHIVSDVQEIVALLKPATFGAAEFVPNATEQEAEGEVLAALAGSSETFAGIGDGAILRNIFAFLQAHPELLQLILTLLKL